MNITSDNSSDSGPVGCTFPLLLCYKIALTGKGKAENSLWLWVMSAVLLEEKCSSMLKQKRKILSLLHSLFHHEAPHLQIKHTQMLRGSINILNILS